MYGDKEAPNKNKPVMKIGRSWATALSGFLAGVVVASLVLVPWLFFLSKLCPSQVPHL